MWKVLYAAVTTYSTSETYTGEKPCERKQRVLLLFVAFNLLNICHCVLVRNSLNVKNVKRLSGIDHPLPYTSETHTHKKPYECKEWEGL